MSFISTYPENALFEDVNMRRIEFHNASAFLSLKLNY